MPGRGLPRPGMCYADVSNVPLLLSDTLAPLLVVIDLNDLF